MPLAVEKSGPRLATACHSRGKNYSLLSLISHFIVANVYLVSVHLIICADASDNGQDAAISMDCSSSQRYWLLADSFPAL